MEMSVPTPRGAPAWGQRSLAAAVGAAVAAVTVLHYLTSAHMLEYHTVYRSLYYLPIAGAAVAFGLRGGALVSLAVTGLYLPHVLGMGEMLPGGLLDNLLELPVFLLVGGLVGALADRERAQRRRVERLRSYIDSILQSLPLGVATTAEGGRPAAQNQAAAALLPALPPPAELAALAPGYHSVGRGQRPLGLHISPLSTPDAPAGARVLVIEDQTERRALEAQLRRNDRLASVGQLAAGIAHEVRNPLAILRATVQLLAGRLAGAEVAEQYARVLIAESDRIDRLVGELLEYARPRPPQRGRLDLTALLHGAAQAVQPYALQHGVRVEAATAPGAAVYADEQQLQQALLNLLLNAIQASPAGGMVRLGGDTIGGRAQITVADVGRGMAPEVLERACDPFFTTRPEGTGLGLALVAAIVAEHGGALSFASRPGAGTTVTIALPQEADDAPRADH